MVVSRKRSGSAEGVRQFGRPKVVYVVGAGFSAGLGYPLVSDLLLRLWPRLRGTLKRDLHKIVSFHHPNFDPKRFATFPNVEELLSEMLVNEELFDASRQYEGKFTRQNLKETSRALLLAITDWFHELSEEVRPGEPKAAWLTGFRDKVLEQDAAIISFNWDLILDELLFGEQIGAAAYGFSPGSRPILLKPHGSLNWFESEIGSHIKERKRAIIHGSEGDSAAVYAFLEFRGPISKHGRLYTPLIVPPALLKDFGKPVFQDIWRRCTAVLSTARKVIFLGYSLPPADIHGQFILRCGFHNQIEGELLAKGPRAKPTGPSQVVIVNPDGAAARRIASIAGPRSECRWVSAPAADWISSGAFTDEE